MSSVHKKIYNKIRVVSYVTHFVTRAFLIAILCFMVIFGGIILLYMGDLLVNSKNGDVNNPLFSTYVIVSPSMVPTIKINDAIIIKRVDNDGYKVGDIITFKSNDINYQDLMVTHRIVNKENISYKNSKYTTKGDNNINIDPNSVQTNAIHGRVLLKIPKVGYIKEFFSNPVNYFICILVPAIIFILYDLGRVLITVYKRKVFSN